MDKSGFGETEKFSRLLPQVRTLKESQDNECSGRD